MFSLPDEGVRQLDRLRAQGRDLRAGRNVSTKQIFTALILDAPEDPDELLALANYGPFAGPPPPAGRRAELFRHRTLVRLPSPITLRLNRLIGHVAETRGVRCSRTAVVVGLMKLETARRRKLAWRRRCHEVMQTEAAGAALDGEDPETVLNMLRPPPGVVRLTPLS